ncbi:MAG TPA: VTT domain-containing protein [Planctomycetota bacterium]|jgi:membrane-associated protein
MHDIIEFFKKICDAQYLVTIGYAGMAAIIFSETGLFFGFFLPGDSLLFAAGMACADGNTLHEIANLDLLKLNLCLIPAAIIGDSVGYWIGFRAGKGMYNREKTFLFRRDHLLATKAFYEKHGGKTIVMARFVPLIRTFAPVVAGIAQMRYRDFIFYNIAGGIGWIISISCAGYFLGGIPFFQKHIEASIVMIVFVSVLPIVITFIKARYFSQKAAQEKA